MKTIPSLYLRCIFFCVLLVMAIVLRVLWPLAKEHVGMREMSSRELAQAPFRNSTEKTTEAQVRESYGKLPLSFESNEGQTDPRVTFLSRSAGYTLFLTHTEAVLVLRHGQTVQGIESKPATQDAEFVEKKPETESVMAMRLVGANPRAHAFGVEGLPGKSNYFLGNDPKKWRTNIPSYAKVNYQNIYPGVDLVYYGSQQQLEYDFVVAPGRDPKVIALEFHGADKIRVDAQGDVVLQSGGGELRLRKPVIYQVVNGLRKSVSGCYVLRGKRFVSFRVGSYDFRKPLVVDPVLVYSTYLGGSSGGDSGYGIAVDSSGNAYVTGFTLSTDFPTASPFQPTLSGIGDAFVTKLNAAGSALLYSTYLGGGGNDYGNGIAVDSSGNAYVTGFTSSTDFPTASPFQPTLSGIGDAFVTKLNAAGSALLYSTYLGGGGDFNDFGNGIAVDSSGNAYITGSTSSTNFPTASPFQPTLSGNSDAFVTKLNTAGAALLYSTYLGGGGNDYGFGIAVDSSGNAYVTGGTNSTNFPTASPFQSTLGSPGFDDVFVTKLNPAGSALVYSTYLGGGGTDDGSAITVDSSGNAYVTGSTFSTNFPTANAFQGTLATGSGFSGRSDAFVFKLNAAGSTLLYSTYLGGPQSDLGTGIAVDSSGNVYVTGRGDSGSFPTVNPFQKTCGGCQAGGPDAFVAKIDATQSGAASLVYSSFLGGSSFDQSYGIAVSASGDAYVTGVAGTGFPITPGAFETSSSQSTSFVAKISPNAAPGLTLTNASLTFGGQTIGTGSAPQAVILGAAGSATLAITSIAITGTNSTDFAQSNTCGTNVAGGGNCTVNVTFSPATTGVKTAAIIITDSAAGSPHTLNLTGTGVPVGFSPSSLAFGNQVIGTTSAPLAVTLTNFASATLTIANIAITGTNSGDFAQSNNCPLSPSSLAAGASCMISVTFKPTAVFSRNAALTITDNGEGSPRTVSLTGYCPPDFTISAAPSTATITAGQSAVFVVTITPIGLSGTVNLSCSGAPNAASCSLPTSVTLSGPSPAALLATITTTKRSIVSPGPSPPIASPYIGLRVGWQWFLLLVALAVLVRPGRWPRVSFRVAMLLIIIWSFGCARNSGGAGGGGSGGTPAGTYTLTLTGTASGVTQVTHNTSVTLTVN